VEFCALKQAIVISEEVVAVPVGHPAATVKAR
jgi:hypothetical protein